MQIFVSGSDEVVRTGVQYLRIEGMFYIGIGILFMLYGYYRAVSRPGVVGGTYGHIARNEGAACLYAVRRFMDWRSGYLGIDSDWLVSGGFCRNFAVKKKPDIEKIAGYSIMKSKIKG